MIHGIAVYLFIVHKDGIYEMLDPPHQKKKKTDIVGYVDNSLICNRT
jgi:hypothetical protein